MHTGQNNHQWLLAACLAAGSLTSAGCRAERKPAPAPTPSQAPVTVRLVVLGDPDLAQSIDLLKAEWHARTGGTLSVAERADEELGELSKFDADAIIYRAERLGTPAESQWISPLPKELLRG